MGKAHSHLMSWGLRLLLGLALVTAMAACAVDSDSDEGEVDGKAVLRVGVPLAPSDLDPAQARTEPLLLSLAYEPLIRRNPSDGTYEPALATEWRYLRNNTVFELVLRDDARFSDGTPVDADAVVAWLEYFAETAGPFVSQMGELTSIEAVDERTVRINLAQPNPSVPALLAFNNWGLVASADALASPEALGTQTFGAGPYTLDPVRTVSGDRYVFVPNEHYYDKSAVEFGEVTVRVLTNASSMLQTIQAGELDVAVGTATTAETAESAGLEIVHAPGAVEALIIADRTGDLAPPLGDVRVRQALNFAIDRGAIADALVGQYGTPTSQLSTPDGWVGDYQDYYDYDPDRARSLLADAGFADGFTLNVLGLPDDSNLIQAVAANLSEVGVTLEETTAPTNPDYLRQIGTQGFPLVSGEIRTDNTMWQTFNASLSVGSFFNFTDWSSPELTQLVSEGARAEDGQESWQEASRLIVEEALFVPVYLFDRMYFVGEGVGNVTTSAENGGAPNPTYWVAE